MFKFLPAYSPFGLGWATNYVFKASAVNSFGEGPQSEQGFKLNRGP